MKKKVRRKWAVWPAFLMMLAMVLSLTFSGSARATSMNDVVALVGAVNSSGELTAIHSGFLMEADSGLVLVTASNDEWALAEAIAVMSPTGEGVAAPAISDSLAGVALLSVSGDMAGVPGTAVSSVLSMSEGDALIYGGIDMTKNSSTVDELVTFYQTSLTGFTEADGYTFALMADEFEAMYAGGPVFNSDGYLVGVLSARGAVLPIDYIVNSISPSGGGNSGDDGDGGSGGGSYGDGDDGSGGGSYGDSDGGSDGGSYGDSGDGGSGGGSYGDGGDGGTGGGSGSDGGSSGSSGTTSLSSVVPIFSGYFLVVFLGGAAAFVASLFIYQNKEMKKRTAGKEEFAEMLQYMGGSEGSGSDGEPAGRQRALEGVGGHFNGRRLALSPGSPVVLGRDPARCTAVYPSNTKGVSGLHCRITVSGNEILLTDCGSTYGTFLAGGQRLAPDVPCRLKSGDTFYLAEPQNTFRVI